MKVLVTGADGMLGSNIVRELLNRQMAVRAFVLPSSPYRSLEGLAIEKVEGNLLDPKSLGQAMQGCDAIIHTAANTSIWPDRSEVVRKVNIEGTQHIIDLALQQKIKRLVYIGTANSFGFGSKTSPGDESRPYQSAKYGLDYMDSKYEAQVNLLKACKERGLPALTINPTFMFGPYDSKPGAGAMILAIYQQKVPGYASGGRNYIYVKDVAVATCNALHQGKIGESYIAGNVNMDYKEAFSTIAQTVGVKAPSLFIPPQISKVYGWLGSQFSRISGKAPTVSYAMARISCDEHYFSAQKAVDELGLPQTDIKIAIKESFNWLHTNGYC
ncbi:MAG: NAD-dependent epimerase/dehydratase family protein [Bacteroidota bacterium]